MKTISQTIFHDPSGWGLKYHKLIMGKPSYDFMVDDKSYNYNSEWYKKLK